MWLGLRKRAGIKRFDTEKQTAIISSYSNPRNTFISVSVVQTCTDLSIPESQTEHPHTHCILFHSVSDYYYNYYFFLSNLPCWQNHRLQIHTHFKRKESACFRKKWKFWIEIWPWTTAVMDQSTYTTSYYKPTPSILNIWHIQCYYTTRKISSANMGF